MPLALLNLALAMAITGSNVVVGKLLAAAMPVPDVLFLRCVLAAVLLAPWALRRTVAPPRGWMLGNVVVQAISGTVLYNILLLAGLRHTGALQAGIVLSSLPAVVALAAAVFLSERLSGRRWVAVVLAAVGVGFVAFARNADLHGSLRGDGLVFGAVGCEAAFVILSRLAANRMAAVRLIFWMQVVSAVCLLPLAWPVLDQAWPALAKPDILALFLYHAVSASVICTLLWYAGMRRVPASLAGLFTVFLPLTAAVLAVLWLGETFVPALGAGFVLTLASLVLATWPARRAATVPIPPPSAHMVVQTPD